MSKQGDVRKRFPTLGDYANFLRKVDASDGRTFALAVLAANERFGVPKETIAGGNSGSQCIVDAWKDARRLPDPVERGRIISRITQCVEQRSVA
ncbi:MAG: hypothetical protein Q7T01_00490 [bacterium]|nr:hypothetical protein [bacterium]